MHRMHAMHAICTAHSAFRTSIYDACKVFLLMRSQCISEVGTPSLRRNRKRLAGVRGL